MFWYQARVYCGKCLGRVEEISGGPNSKGIPTYWIKCHGEELVLNANDQEQYRVNGPVPDTYLVFNEKGLKRVTKRFQYKKLPGKD